VSFNWVGFLAAMGSNITFQSRNVLSKELMTGKAKKGLNQMNLFSIIMCMSVFLLLPFTLAVEGFQFAGPFMTSEVSAMTNTPQFRWSAWRMYFTRAPFIYVEP
jgi:hypothetical protein